MKKCVIVPDSFKGTMKATDICDISKNVIKQVFPDCYVVCIPIADGGEGTVDTFLQLPGWEKCEVDTTGPYNEPVKAYYARKGKSAVIEMAMAAGLPMVVGKENPAVTSTYGVGTMIQKAIKDGCNDIILGLGGSCTNDCGAGMAAALGVNFLDSDGNIFIPTGNTLQDVKEIKINEAEGLFNDCKIRAMCDVTNPLFGSLGAAYVFAPQKGANEDMVEELDANLRHFSTTIEQRLRADVSKINGAGAAGGMGAAVLAFLQGTLNSGIETILEVTNFDEEIKDADLVITGEGKVDAQSLSGKVISGVSSHAKKQSIPVIVLTGAVEKGIEKDLYNRGVTGVFSINRRPEEFAICAKDAAQNFSLTLESILRIINKNGV